MEDRQVAGRAAMQPLEELTWLVRTGACQNGRLALSKQAGKQDQGKRGSPYDDRYASRLPASQYIRVMSLYCAQKRNGPTRFSVLPPFCESLLSSSTLSGKSTYKDTQLVLLPITRLLRAEQNNI